MSAQGILIYSLRAGIFALAVCAVYAGICRLRGGKAGGKRLLAILYLAALVQITVLRGGVNWRAVFAGSRPVPQLVPLCTVITLAQGGGLWNLVYNVAGNLIWFVPLGMLLGRRKWIWPLGLGALVSAGIEICQYLLITGAADIDDVILNALGAYLGWIICRIIKKKCG